MFPHIYRAGPVPHGCLKKKVRRLSDTDDEFEAEPVTNGSNVGKQETVWLELREL